MPRNGPSQSIDGTQAFWGHHQERTPAGSVPGPSSDLRVSLVYISSKLIVLSAPKSRDHQDGSEESSCRAPSPMCSSTDRDVCLQACPHSAGHRCATFVCLCVELLQSSWQMELNICYVWLFCITSDICLTS